MACSKRAACPHCRSAQYYSQSPQFQSPPQEKAKKKQMIEKKKVHQHQRWLAQFHPQKERTVWSWSTSISHGQSGSMLQTSWCDAIGASGERTVMILVCVVTAVVVVIVGLSIKDQRGGTLIALHQRRWGSNSDQTRMPQHSHNDSALTHFRVFLLLPWGSGSCSSSQ